MTSETARRNGNVRWPARASWALAPALALLLAAPSARGQCLGDCDGDGSVQVAEIITGLGIALESKDLTECPEFDGNDNQAVGIDELVGGVDNSIRGCPEATVTPTPMETPTSTPTVPLSCGDGVVDEGEECDDGSQCDDGVTDCTGDAPICEDIVNGDCLPRNGDGCQENCRLGFCGDGIVDNRIEDPESCDDGNTVEGFGDRCPADCRIAACTASGERLTANVDFSTTSPDLIVIGLEVFVRYPDGVVDVPGVDDQQSVKDRMTSLSFSVTPNDFNFAAQAVLIDPLQFGVEPGTAMTIEFDRCQGADAPAATDFTCILNSASGLDPDTFLPIDITDQVDCSIVLP